MDLDLRKVRYFVAVAELLHFGRAAEQLHIAQPVLSRQIRALEKDLDTTLFERDSHGVTLTTGGLQLLDDGRALLASADATRRRVQRSARGPHRLVVGFRAGIVVTHTVRAYGAAHPGIEVRARRVEWDDQERLILDGTVDLAYLRRPIREEGLTLLPLFAEPRVAMLPGDHRLAGKQDLVRADLDGGPGCGTRTRVRTTYRSAASRRSSRPWPPARASPWSPSPWPSSTRAPTSPTCPSPMPNPTRWCWRGRRPGARP